MKKMAVYFTDRQATAIESLAIQTGITFAEALRRMLDAYLDIKDSLLTSEMKKQESPGRD